MGTFELFWFFVWRMALWGLELGAGLGVAYGLLIGIVPFGILVLPFTVAFGVLIALPLGIAEGTLLFFVTLLYYRRGAPRAPHRYREIAGIAGAATGVLALAVLTELGFRRSGLSLLSSETWQAGDLYETIVVVSPTLAAGCASWWASREVAERYSREFLNTPG
jgi:hypothetical protein